LPVVDRSNHNTGSCLPYNHFAWTELKIPFSNRNVTVVCVFVTTAICLPIRYLEIGYITPLFISILQRNAAQSIFVPLFVSRSLPSNGPIRQDFSHITCIFCYSPLLHWKWV
jgi:hypothetical protein